MINYRPLLSFGLMVLYEEPIIFQFLKDAKLIANRKTDILNIDTVEGHLTLEFDEGGALCGYFKDNSDKLHVTYPNQNNVLKARKQLVEAQAKSLFNAPTLLLSPEDGGIALASQKISNTGTLVIIERNSKSIECLTVS